MFLSLRHIYQYASLQKHFIQPFLIKLSSQITLCVCGTCRDKILIMYDVASTAVAATSFFTGEKEIFDFVFERVKRCIAAKKVSLLKYFI